MPLAEGERPRAVTVGALLALVLGVVNFGAYALGFEIRGDRPPLFGLLAFVLLMLTMAWGMWRARYWAVLGMQGLLGIVIVAFSLPLAVASNLWAVAVCLVVMLPAGTLFWFLVKAMARIQMPVRR